MTFSRVLAVCVAAVALVLGACGNDDAVDDAAQPPPEAARDEPAATTAPPQRGITAPPTGQRQPGCDVLPEAVDGVYPVRDAGEIVVTREGNALWLVETRPAEGWTATGDTEDDADDVEVYFRSGDREIELEAEIDDGRLKVEVCER